MPRALLRATMGVLLLALPALSVAQPQSDRPSDSLLTRPFLQAVVDLQVERDGPVLIELLENDDPVVRARAAFALASVQDTSAIPALLTLLDDPSPHVRADAAFALGQMPGTMPTAPLLDALSASSDEPTQRRLIEALGKQGDAASLVRLVVHEWPAALQADVALAVGRYGLRDVHAPEAVAYLVEHLKQDDPDLRLNAAYYFGRMRDPSPWQAVADTLRNVLDDLEPDDPTAMHLLLGLGRLNDPMDTPRLRAWLTNGKDWRTRVNAVQALSKRTDEQGIRALLYDHLVDPSEHVAVAAAEALNDGKSWSKTDRDLIKKWVYYNSYAWRITAPLIEGLARQDETAFVLNELTRRRGAPPLLSYRAALPALAHLPHADAFDQLVNDVHHQDAVLAHTALTTLVQRWKANRAAPKDADAFFDTFVYALSRKDVALTYAAANALTDSLFRPYGATQALIDAYQNRQPSVEREQMTILLDALGATGDTTAVPLLRREVTNPHPDIITAAGKALHQITGEAAVLPNDPAPPDRTITWSTLRELGPRPRLKLETNKGTILLELNAEEAPLTTQTMVGFARDGRYVGVPFHRVVPNFVIQSGDFERGDGWGGPPFEIRSEFTRLPYGRGTLGMASSGKDTEGSQFFITHSMQPHLDGHYTAVGTVIEGQDVVDTIYPFDRILGATVEPQSP